MLLNLEKLNDCELQEEPYEHLVLDGFIDGKNLDSVRNDFPDVPSPGSHPPSNLKITGAFEELVAELQGESLRNVVQDKFNIDLTDRPTMYTVRGMCRKRDGKIHTDSKTKIITVLLYLNDDNWPTDGGRLRILRNGTDLEDFSSEVEPKGGTLIMFKRSDNSWHGHHPFEGKRRALQLNWVVDGSVVKREQGRHGVSSKLKNLFRIS
ncbi:MAG: 2OG-Fe(II) oxygenase [Paracoccaceae bacterium]